jgi:hypothetical protein
MLMARLPAATYAFWPTVEPQLEELFFCSRVVPQSYPRTRAATELEPRRDFPIAPPTVFLRWAPSFQPPSRQPDWADERLWLAGDWQINTGRPVSTAAASAMLPSPAVSPRWIFTSRRAATCDSHFWPTGIPNAASSLSLPNDRGKTARSCEPLITLSVDFREMFSRAMKAVTPGQLSCSTSTCQRCPCQGRSLETVTPQAMV